MHVYIKKGSLNGKRFVEKYYEWTKLKAPCNRKQQCWTTYPNIVGCYMLHWVLRSHTLLHVAACCCVLLRVAPACSFVLLGVIAQSLKPVKLLIQQLPPFLFFFSYMITEAECFLELRKPLLIHFCVEMWPYCSVSFQSFVLRLQ